MRIKLWILTLSFSVVCAVIVGCGPEVKYFNVQPKTEKVYGGNSVLFSQTIVVISGDSVRNYKEIGVANAAEKDFILVYPGLEDFVRDELATLFKKVGVAPAESKDPQDYDYRVVIEYSEKYMGFAGSLKDIKLTLNFEGADKYYSASKKVDFDPSTGDAAKVVFMPWKVAQMARDHRDNSIRKIEQTCVELMQAIKTQILADASFFQKS